jgi:hypothetical protein
MADYQDQEETDYAADDYNDDYGDNDAEDEVAPEEMERRVAEMEDELNKLNNLQSSLEKQIGHASTNMDENSMLVLLLLLKLYESYLYY